MSVEGAVTVTRSEEAARPVKEGDLLKVNDVLEVGDGAYADIAYDREWNNVTRVEESSKIRIRALYPTMVQLDAGGIYAKLKQLPKESSFEVQTPTAIASVRGTEYRTTYTGGETEVYNVSDSDVYVYGVDESGHRQAAQPTILRNTQKTEVLSRGAPPLQPRRMDAQDFRPVQHARERIEGKMQENIAHGRFGQIQDVKQVENGEWKARPHDERRDRPPMGEGGPDRTGPNAPRDPNKQQQGNRPARPTKPAPRR